MLYNIVTCDDNPSDLKNVIKATNIYFQSKKDFDCKIHSFHDYDNKFLDFLYTKRLPNLILLLDIETPSGNGFDIARAVKRFDQNIPIIYITGHHKKYINQALDVCDMDGYIDKLGNIEKQLQKNFDKILIEKGKRFIFHITGNNVTYILNVKKVNYFTTDGKNQIKVCGFYYPNMYLSVNNLYKQLDSRFIKSHQSCIVNLDNVKTIDIKGKTIYFNDGSSTDLIARNFISKNKDWLYEHYSDKIIFK